MAKFVGGDVKYVGVGEAIGIAPLPEPIATVKFNVRNPGIYRVEVTKDGSWTARYISGWKGNDNKMIDKQHILKPCPFCGSAAHIWEDERFSNGGYDFPKWYIGCLGCGIKTPTARMDQVVNIWNRRI